MFVLIICAVLGSLIGLLNELSFGDTLDGVFGFFYGGFLGAVTGFFLAVFVGLFVYSGPKYVTHDRVQLQNLVDNDQLHGSFFLGSGTIDDVPSYSWYEQTENNSYERRDAPAEEGTVHYLTNSEHPYYVATVNHDWGFWNDWGWGGSEGAQVAHYDFYIPRGSITRDYKLDAK